MPTNPNVPMSREEWRQKLENLVSNSTRQNPLTKPTLDSLLDLINQEKREMIERMPRHKHIPCEWNKCIDTIRDQLEQENE